MFGLCSITLITIELGRHSSLACLAGKSISIHASLQGTHGHFLVHATLDAPVRMVETYQSPAKT